MISRKYADDFRMEKSVNDKGKVVKKAVYIGPFFAYCAGEKELALSRRLCLPVCLLLWVLFAVCFMQDGAAPRQVWVAAIFLVTVFPLIYLTWSSVTMLLSHAPFDRETSDDLYKKYAGASVAQMALSGAACLASGIALLVTRSFVMPGDLVFLLGNLASLGLSVLLFSRRETFKTAEVDRSSELFAKLIQEKNEKGKK